MYAPDFVFSITAALVAERYIRSSLELETIAYKFSIFLNTVYEAENVKTLKGSAEAFIYSMGEAGINNADDMLLNYQYENFLRYPSGRLRNWSPVFRDPIRGVKRRSYTIKSVNVGFKAFVYRTKHSGEYTCPTGWSLGNQKSNKFLSDLDNLEVSAFDIITSRN
jgi:hypothetical protein|tara:strand:- start:1896 stop:2390 length:495 start_codon:yes stop_codon:yes gene_type:complete